MQSLIWSPLAWFAVMSGLGGSVPQQPHAFQVPSEQSTLKTNQSLIALKTKASPTVSGCPVFPADNIWNARVDGLPVDSRSRAYIDSMGRNTHLHPDFGSGKWNGGPIGIPFNVVSGTQPKVKVKFTYATESDSGPYPIPTSPLIEGGPKSSGDRHVLLLDQDNCKLYELWKAYPQLSGTWKAGSGAIFDLNSNALRRAGWTSADAAGLPIFPGLVRYAEVSAGEIAHAIRFTASVTQRKYVWPARHYASSNTNLKVPPMGQRFRLKASFDISPYPRQVQVLLIAMKKYGLILADNGSDWYISGIPDSRWNNDVLVSSFNSITGDAFEAVDVSQLMIDSNSGATR
ncbi:MAG: hypothetical protein WCD18_19160 [Thermosynechococcaceae cyanobacterium]